MYVDEYIKHRQQLLVASHYRQFNYTKAKDFGCLNDYANPIEYWTACPVWMNLPNAKSVEGFPHHM